jgi:hypothetical protein
MITSNNVYLTESAKIIVDNTTFDDYYTKKLDEVVTILEDVNSPLTRTYYDKLYESILSKAHIDFGDIPKSEGNIHNYSGYNTMVETLDTIRSLAGEQKVKEADMYADIVVTAIKNIASMSATYQKGFTTKTAYVALEYNLFVYLCVEATSAILYSFVDYIKDPAKDTMEIKIKNSKLRADEFYFDQLKSFNKMIAKHGIDYRKTLETMCNKGKNNFLGVDTVVGIGVISAVVFGIIPVTRACIYQIYKLRSSVSDFLEMQSKFLELNESCVRNNSNFDDKKKKDILDRQKKLAATLKKLSDGIRVKSAKSITDSKKELDNDNKSFSMDGLRDSASNDPLQLV